MMFKVVTPDEMRAIEAASDQAGFSYASMLESAGRMAANRALEIIADVAEPRITILVGPGNNGGDGLVAGLFIAQDHEDAEVRFYLLKDRDDQYIQTARDAGLFIAMAENDTDKRVLRNMVASADLVMDALFGIGVRLPIRDEAQKIMRQATRAINERRRARPEKVSINVSKTEQIPKAAAQYVLAIDTPSGLDGETGKLDSNTIKADETITFIAAKRGQLLFPGAEAVGRLTIAEIGTSPKLEPYDAIQHYISDARSIAELLPARPMDAHKGTFGKAMVVAGSVNYVGAAALAAEAAYRTGAGLVSVGAPGSVIAALAGHIREATWLLLPHDMGVIAEGAANVLAKEIRDYDSLLVGPGLGREKTTGDFLLNLLRQNKASTKPTKRRLGFQTETTSRPEENLEDSGAKLPPLVIDADGLNLLAEMDEWWKLLPENTILTPHPGEMARLAGVATSEVQANRLQIAQEKAAEWHVILVLKGAHTIIATPDGDVTFSPIKTDALATAGTGDVLAGTIAGLLTQKMDAANAAIAGTYVHGLAGVVAAEGSSTRSVLAGDVLNALSEAFRRLDAELTP